MDFLNMSIWLHWFYETMQILPRLFIVVVAAFIAIRFEWLRQALRGDELKWRYRGPAILVFALLAIIGTHSGIPIDIHQDLLAIDLTAKIPEKLGDTQAVVGFRDTMVLASGLIGGPWVGFGAGLLAGVERYQLGGFAAQAGSLATLLLGVFAGGIRFLKPDWVATVKGVFWVAVVGTLLHRLIILIMVRPYSDALALTWEVVVPVMVVNTLGCALFFWIMRDLDRDRLENEVTEARLLALQSELRALRAQVEPHFLNNTLNDLQDLIGDEPEKAIAYVCQLAEFFNYTREFTELNTVSLAQEFEQLQRYLELQQLGLGDKLQFSFEFDEELLAIQVLPGCLLTLVENALKHGFKGRPAPYQLAVSAQVEGENLLLKVTDNGRGIAPGRLAELGKNPVQSENKGGGVALHQLLQSLRLAFGESVELGFTSKTGQGTVARLRQAKRRVA
ncbi:MAG: histidine kinase [Methylococcales bacterium]|nr:histidine kinase [Methylococcales bacterium]